MRKFRHRYFALQALLCAIFLLPAPAVGNPVAKVAYDVIMILLEAVANKAIDLAVDPHADDTKVQDFHKDIENVRSKILELQKQQTASAQQIANLERQLRVIQNLPSETPHQTSLTQTLVKVGRIVELYPIQNYFVFETDFPVSMREVFLLETANGSAPIRIEKRYENWLSATLDPGLMRMASVGAPVYIARIQSRD